MTSVSFHNNELNKIIESFYSKVKHPYLDKYIKDPYVDEDQATILYFMLKQKDFDFAYISQCITTTILVQAALDTHEEVGSTQVLTDTLKKKRQLTVLAGDYYSSLYYYFLSKINDVSLIRVLAQSIQEINESKMNVYKNHRMDIEGCFDDVRVIDSSLLNNIATLLHLQEWKSTVDEFFFFKRLLKERFVWMHTGVRGALIELMLKESPEELPSLEDDRYLLERFDRLIDGSKDKLLTFSFELSSLGTYLTKRVQELLSENQYDQECVMEEG